MVDHRPARLSGRAVVDGRLLCLRIGGHDHRIGAPVKIAVAEKLGSVAGRLPEAGHMNKSKLMAIGAELALIATTILYLVCHELWIALTSVAVAAALTALVSRVACTASHTKEDGIAVGVGTVRTVVDDEPDAAGERQIWIEVSSVDGDTFIGRLVHHDGAADLSSLRPGLLVLVAFDPAAREQLSLADDVLAVRASALDLA
jgi:hypothetical protein